MDAKKSLYILPFVLIIIFLSPITHAYGLEQQQKLSAALKGDVSVQTKASGTAQFILNITKEGNSQVVTGMMYTLNVTGLNPKNITQVYIAKGAEGHVGPLMYILYPVSNSYHLIHGHSDSFINGILAKGEIIPELFKGPMEDKGPATFKFLLENIKQPGVYVSVGTIQHPYGEIRGQVSNATDR